MIVTTLLALAATAQQPSDPSSTARVAYTTCLRQFMDKSVRDRMAENAFNQALPQQCSTQEQAFRQAIATREQRYQTAAAEIEQIVTDELNDARSNIRELYAMSSSPR